jgi:DMSO/TMAO reductase YedYZ heme-binding membrane subunit
MKLFIYTVIFLALVIIGYSTTVLNFDALLKGDSGTAVLVIVGSLCLIILMGILLTSRSIAEKHNS